MKKTIGIILFIVTIVLLNSTCCYASSSITYFYAEGIKIDNKDIEILSHEVKIDTITSKVKNRTILKNNSAEKIACQIIIPLENKELNIAVKNIEIQLNGEKVQYTKNEKGEYVIKTKIPANEGKKLEISYETDNDLYNAKVIKCNFDNFEDRTIGKVKVDIRIDEKNIPLVEKIYPGHYTFDNNVISVEYYNYKPNTITREVIVQKETFNNLLYGREEELRDFDKNIITDWMNGKTNFKTSEDEYPEGRARDIWEYVKIKKGKEVWGTSSFGPLVYEFYLESIKNKKLKDYSDSEIELLDKTICIEFAKTEGDKKLYVERTIVEGEDEDSRAVQKLVETSENEILKTSFGFTEVNGARLIYVGEGINGEDLNASKEEIVEYVNSANTDMFIRIEIYDGVLEEKEFKAGKVLNNWNGTIEYYEKQDYNEETDEVKYKTLRIGNALVGYYDDKNYEIAKQFSIPSGEKELMEKSSYIEDGYNEQYSLYYKDYNEYKKNYWNDYFKETLKKFPNEYISNNCKVPTVIQFIANRKEENGKYVVKFFEDAGIYNGSVRGIATVNLALKTTSAKNMISENRKNNENTKLDIEERIKDLKITENESQIQEELKREGSKVNFLNDKKNIFGDMKKEDILVFEIIGGLIILCLIILIVKHIRKNNKKTKEV